MSWCVGDALLKNAGNNYLNLPPKLKTNLNQPNIFPKPWGIVMHSWKYQRKCVSERKCIRFFDIWTLFLYDNYLHTKAAIKVVSASLVRRL